MVKLIAAVVAILLPAIAFASPYKDATAAYAHGDYARALRIVVPLAESGDPDAQMLLGRMYAFGKGVQKDFVVGCMWQNLASVKLHREDSSCSEIASGMTPEQTTKWNFLPAQAYDLNQSAAAPKFCAAGELSCDRIAEYLTSASDIEVSSLTPTRIIEGVVDNASQVNRTVILFANGTVSPKGQVYVRLQVFVDGKPVGSGPKFDWRNNPVPAARSYSTAAAAVLSHGRHVVMVAGELLARRSQTKIVIAKGASLSILSSTAQSVQWTSLTKDTNSISTKSRGIAVSPLLLARPPVTIPSLSFFSANVFGDGGDAMVGLSPSGAVCPWTAEQSWSIQDLVDQAEREAPMFVQGIAQRSFPARPQAVAAVFPWAYWNRLDPVRFRVRSDSTLLVLEGPRTLGLGYSLVFRNVPCMTSNYRCYASSRGYDFCPKIGERSVVATGRVTIDAKSDGVLMIVASVVPTADHDDRGGTVFLGLAIDGVDVGAPVKQDLPRQSVESARTLVVTYLADRNHRLSLGTHTIEAWFYAAKGSDFKWISLPNELVLTYFD